MSQRCLLIIFRLLFSTRPYRVITHNLGYGKVENIFIVFAQILMLIDTYHIGEFIHDPTQHKQDETHGQF